MFLAGAALVMSSCSDDATEIPGVTPEDGLITLTEISASLPESRTSLEYVEYGTGTPKTYWQVGDYISVWSDEQFNTPVLFKVAEIGRIINETTGERNTDATYATFRVVNKNESVRGTEFYALYNGSETASKTVTLNADQDGDGSSRLKDGIMPMVAHATGEAPNYVSEFNFSNLCGIMALTLSITDADNVTLEGVTINANRTRIAGMASVSYNGGWTLNWSSSSYVLERNCHISNMTRNSEYTVYALVPPGPYPSLTVDTHISINGDPKTITRRRSSATAIQIVAGQITRVAKLGIKTAAPHVYVPGDVYPFNEVDEQGKPIVHGVVFEAAADGQSGKIVASKRIAGTYSFYTGEFSEVDDEGNIVDPQAPEIPNPSFFVGSLTNGYENMQPVVENKGLDDFPVFKACYDFRTANPVLDWYVPALNELQAIIDNYPYLSNKWNAATGLGALVTATNNVYLATSTITGQFPWYYIYSISRIKSKWQTANDEADIDGSTKYTVIPIATFESK